MKSSVTYRFETQSHTGSIETVSGGPTIAGGNFCGIMLIHNAPSHWDPDTQKEIVGPTHILDLSPEDARELAENLWKAAEHSAQFETPDSKDAVQEHRKQWRPK